ncbi:hypothetical protein B0J18DRAFT_138715 [Chaetomium sp. MPI-SDFR-AT-0129]|nr:hypothetical protein B0J18DRAFT_138715 [Chaetomium sp. MPI-SDFR-AT-0129]
MCWFLPPSCGPWPHKRDLTTLLPQLPAEPASPPARRRRPRRRRSSQLLDPAWASSQAGRDSLPHTPASVPAHMYRTRTRTRTSPSSEHLQTDRWCPTVPQGGEETPRGWLAPLVRLPDKTGVGTGKAPLATQVATPQELRSCMLQASHECLAAIGDLDSWIAGSQVFQTPAKAGGCGARGVHTTSGCQGVPGTCQGHNGCKSQAPLHPKTVIVSPPSPFVGHFWV